MSDGYSIALMVVIPIILLFGILLIFYKLVTFPRLTEDETKDIFKRIEESREQCRTKKGE